MDTLFKALQMVEFGITVSTACVGPDDSRPCANGSRCSNHDRISFVYTRKTKIYYVVIKAPSNDRHVVCQNTTPRPKQLSALITPVPKSKASACSADGS